MPELLSEEQKRSLTFEQKEYIIVELESAPNILHLPDPGTNNKPQTSHFSALDIGW
jgi:hypothetical protein